MSRILKYVYPASILAGTIIGAGMFSLPFIFEQSGFWLGFLYLAFFIFVFWMVHTMYADIILRTEKLPGFMLYAKKYLGAWSVLPAMLATVIGIMFASSIYLVLSTSFVRLALPQASAAVVVYSFWALGSLAIFMKAKRLAILEFIVVGAIAVLVGIIFLLGIFGGNYSGHNFNILPSALPLFSLPFGPVLFSLSGRSGIPSLLEDAEENNISTSNISSLIFWGTAIPGFLYLVFVVGIWGISGAVSENAVSGISPGVSLLLPALGIVGLASLFDSYVPLGVSVKKILESDFKLSHLTSGLIVVILPILIYQTGLGFLKLVGITGGIFLAIESIFIALIWDRINTLGKPRLLIKNFGESTAYLIIVVFIIGAIAEIIYL